MLGRIVSVPYLGPAVVFLLDRVFGPLVATVLTVLGPVVALLVDVVSRVVGLILAYVRWWGVWYGAMAYAVGYGLLYAGVRIVDPSPPGWLAGLIDFFNISTPDHWQIAGWAFYSMHTVKLRIPDPPFDSTRTNVLSGGVESLLFLYPAVLLLVAGMLVARNKHQVREGFLVGISMAVSYSLLMMYIVDRLAFRGTITIFVVVDTTLYTAAVGYPLVFGTLGAMIAISFDVPYLSRIDDVPVVSGLNEIPSRVVDLLSRSGDLPVLSRFR